MLVRHHPSTPLYEGSTHGEALARCEHLILERRPFGLITGPEGSGKSRVLTDLETRCEAYPEILVSLIDLSRVNADGFLNRAARGLGLWAPGAPRHELVDLIHERCRGLAECGMTQVLLLDELEFAQPDVVPVLRSLLSPAGRLGGLTIIAASRLPLSADLASLVEDFGELRIEIRHLSGPDADAFLELLAQGMKEMLDPNAAAAIQEVSGGSPRQMERIARLASLAARAEASETISRRTIEGVLRELQPILESSRWE